MPFSAALVAWKDADAARQDLVRTEQELRTKRREVKVEGKKLGEVKATK